MLYFLAPCTSSNRGIRCRFEKFHVMSLTNIQLILYSYQFKCYMVETHLALTTTERESSAIDRIATQRNGACVFIQKIAC